MRLFLAVVPPPATQALAASVIDALRSPGDGVSWVKPDNLHYTVRFIGEVGEDGARRIGEAAREAAGGLPRFEATLGAPGAFPDARRARVLWLGLSAGDEPFARLARALEAALAQRGFAPESKGFNAHLTLGRVRKPGRDWTAALAGAGAPVADAARFAVDALQVIVSQLSSRGSIYTVRERAELRA
jgi:2'-5' RNA ligase